ncbi:MAG: response regulator [Eggerthellaceae bacterium]|nr:response regulator [Eggerthellaceae bacterium]
MNQIQWVTVTVIALVFVCISVAGILLQRQHNRRRLDKKDAELRSREQLFGVLADNTNDIFVMFSLPRWNKRPKVEYVSPNIKRLIGIAAEDVRHNLSLLSQTALDPACNLLDESIRHIPLGETRHVSCERVHQSTGERRWFSETLYHLSLDNAEKYILVLSDRTEERQASDTLSEALAIAKSSNEAKSSFLAKMSHDIRTPINAITGMTRIAQENVDNAQKTADCLNVIAHSSQHLLGLINDVLDMSKIESGQMHLQEQTCTLDSILEDIDSIIAPQAQAKGQTLVYDTSRAPHRTCICDRLRLNQVLLNLLSNAVKYTPEGGTVRFTVEEIENMKDRFIKSRFIVADNGIGMPREFIERIFEPFERSDQESVSDVQGTGLGMPITKAIVDAMGGSISIESEVGKGSTFTVTLEMRVAADQPEPLDEESEGSDEAYSFEGKLFLLAEDNDINALIMQELLDMEGAQAEWAENGQEAVRMFSEKPAGHYDVILMDVQMPVMDGYAATAAIRALPREDAATVPIVALTANAFAEDVHRALEAGMNAHVAKPVDMKGLGRTLAGL